MMSTPSRNTEGNDFFFSICNKTVGQIIRKIHPVEKYITFFFVLLTCTETFPVIRSKVPFSYTVRIPLVRFATSLTLSFKGTLTTKRTKVPGGITATELDCVFDVTRAGLDDVV